MLEELAGAIDYPDEIPEPAHAEFSARLSAADDALVALVRDWERGRLVREGLSLAIVGPPNAGKSSLLNALLGEERAIVAPVAGTTRDIIEDRFVIDGVPVRVLDTAGLRASDDAIERIGIERARRALAACAVALVVVDGSQPLDRDALDVLAATRLQPRVVLVNKADLGCDDSALQALDGERAIVGSVHEPATVDAVAQAIAQAGWRGERIDVARPHLASARQAAAVARAREALLHARDILTAGDALDLIAPELLSAVAALGEITGAVATEAMLDGIFARFCVGK
jgi:tRNA modification GTPase